MRLDHPLSLFDKAIHCMRISLSGKMLVTLFVSVAIVMVAVIYLTVSHETQEMLHEMNAGSEEMTLAIYAGIKYPMAVGDNAAVERQLIDIGEKLKNIEVFICDVKQRIIFSSNKDVTRSEIGRYIYNENVRQALALSLESGRHPVEAFEDQVDGNRYLIRINAIPNQKECFQCHDSSRKVLGAIILRKSTDRNYFAIRGLRNANIFISIMGICAIITLSYALMTRLVSMPIRKLAADVRELPEKISAGNLEMRVTDRADEIGALQNSFDQMALELDEKRRAIEKAGRKLATANRELEAFAYSVSHDLRAPLRNIDGFSKILLDEFSENLDERAKHYLSRVRDGTARMSLLIDDMLTFSRIGRAELQLKRTRCRDIIGSIVEHLANEIKTRNVSVIVGELPDMDCDSILMHSLFLNLISNALKFTRTSERPEITIGYDRERQSVFVHDNGIGFDMRYHDKIFQVFQRLHLPEEYEGTGIGLAIVKRIAERHKGKAWAESGLGEGSTFFIKSPLFKEV